MIGWSEVRRQWRAGAAELGMKDVSYETAKEMGLVPEEYEVDAASERWWRDIVKNLFKRPTDDGTTEAICVQPGFWKGSDECGWDEHNQAWNRRYNHREAVEQELSRHAAYMEERFARGPERREDLSYGDETDEDDYR